MKKRSVMVPLAVAFDDNMMCASTMVGVTAETSFLQV